MRTNLQLFRWLSKRLPGPESRRIVLITGARQTGKTTLTRKTYPALRYLNLDSAEDREALRATSATMWGRTVGAALLDEIQKEPSLLEKVKFAFDGGELDFSAITGSSRLLLLRQAQETLAGRAFLFSLWPLMASELSGRSTPPLFDQLLMAGREAECLLKEQPSVLLGEEEAVGREAISHLLAWGGMPELVRLEDDDRREWLGSYLQTFVESDLASITRLADLDSFRKLLKVAMLRCGGLLTVAELARDSQVSASTARRYLDYLEVSFQTITLAPYSRNLTSSVVKAPKLYWSDLGILRRATWQWGEVTGAQFENLVVAEAHKWVATLGRDARLFFYRTRSGLELDLLIETPSGLLGVEVKNREAAHPSDLRPMALVAEAVGKEWLGGLVVHRGRTLEPLLPDKNIWSMPVHRLFS